ARLAARAAERRGECRDWKTADRNRARERVVQFRRGRAALRVLVVLFLSWNRCDVALARANREPWLQDSHLHIMEAAVALVTARVVAEHVIAAVVLQNPAEADAKIILVEHREAAGLF